MSSERFDKLIKKQLESVKTPYQPQAWDRFQKRLPMPGFWPWLVRFGGWVVSGLMLTGWITTLYSLHENQQVLKQLSATLARPAQLAAPGSVTPASVAEPVHRIDTLYVVKRTVVEHRHYYAPTASASLAREPEKLTETNSFVEPLIEPTGRLSDLSAARVPKNAGRLRGRPDSRERASASGSDVLPTEVGAVKRGNKTGTVRRDNKKGNTKTASSIASDTVQSVASQTDTPDETVAKEKEPAASAEPASQPAPRPDSVAQKPASLPVPAEAKAQPAQQRRPAFQFASLKPRVGIETMATPHSIGVGPMLELFPGENLGLSVGLQASGLHSENHRGLDDFNSATGKEFIDQYRAFLPAQYDRIEDISIQTSVISLPVNLKYYVPVGRNWSVLFQTGTSFDLAAYQQVWYESFYKGVEQRNSFELKAEPHFFHNFQFGAGIQFHKSRISGQFVPYYLYDFRSITNTPRGSNFGLKASVWLDLFK